MMTLTIVVSIDSRPEDGDEADPSTQESDPGRPPLILTRDVSDGGQGGGGPKQHDQCHVVERFKEVLPPLGKKGDHRYNCLSLGTKRKHRWSKEYH